MFNHLQIQASDYRMNKKAHAALGKYCRSFLEARPVLTMAQETAYRASGGRLRAITTDEIVSALVHYGIEVNA